MEYATIASLRERHPAWRLLRAGNSTLILSFLGAFFVEANRGACPASELAAAKATQRHLNSERDSLIEERARAGGDRIGELERLGLPPRSRRPPNSGFCGRCADRATKRRRGPQPHQRRL